MAKPIGTLGTINTLTIGGRVFTDLANLITLRAYATGASNSTLIKAGTSVGYQVTAGKTLHIFALRMYAANNGNGVFSVILNQSDNDVGLDTATALTNPITFAAGDPSAGNYDGLFLFNTAWAYPSYEIASGGDGSTQPGLGKVLTGKYLTMVAGVACTIQAFGYEL